jgi:hypothetical protein
MAEVAQEIRLERQASAAKLLPEDYISARKKLKRAVTEHYSGLEVLNNYRVSRLFQVLVSAKLIRGSRF